MWRNYICNPTNVRLLAIWLSLTNAIWVDSYRAIILFLCLQYHQVAGRASFTLVCHRRQSYWKTVLGVHGWRGESQLRNSGELEVHEENEFQHLSVKAWTDLFGKAMYMQGRIHVILKKKHILGVHWSSFKGCSVRDGRGKVCGVDMSLVITRQFKVIWLFSGSVGLWVLYQFSNWSVDNAGEFPKL